MLHLVVFGQAHEIRALHVDEAIDRGAAYGDHLCPRMSGVGEGRRGKEVKRRVRAVVAGAAATTKKAIKIMRLRSTHICTVR